MISASGHSQDIGPDGETEEVKAEPRDREGSLRDHAVRGAAREITNPNLMRGDVGTLGPLVQLTSLDLYATEATGDVRGLAPLVQLDMLSLAGTKVTGDVRGLAPLVQLTHFWLYGTAVAGCDAFCAPGGPFLTHCPSCSSKLACFC